MKIKSIVQAKVAGGAKVLAVLAAGILALNTAWGQGQGWFNGFDYATPYSISTIAGLPEKPETTDGTGSAARFREPTGLVVDTNENVYVADLTAYEIREMTPVGTNWVVTTIAGNPLNNVSQDGTNRDIWFSEPAAIAMDNAGNLYVADTYGIRKLAPAGTNWISSTIAGGLSGPAGSKDGTNGAAQFNYPLGITIDGAGNLYVADTYNDTIRRVAPEGTNWVVTTIAGTAGTDGETDGTNQNASFAYPVGIAADRMGNLFVADTDLNAGTAIREVSPVGTNWVVRTLTSSGGGSDGTNLDASFYFVNQEAGITVDASDNLYIAESGESLIREMSPQGTNWVTTTLAGDEAAQYATVDGTGTNAVFGNPSAIAMDSGGNLFVGDAEENVIREGALFVGVPNVAISRTAPNAATIWWVGVGYTLQTNGNLRTTNWGAYGGTINSNNGTNSVTVTPAGPLFFRLSQ